MENPTGGITSHGTHKGGPPPNIRGTQRSSIYHGEFIVKGSTDDGASLLVMLETIR